MHNAFGLHYDGNAFNLHIIPTLQLYSIKLRNFITRRKEFYLQYTNILINILVYFIYQLTLEFIFTDSRSEHIDI